MSHLSDADEQAFEQLLQRIGEDLRPAPGPRFYQRLAGAPWQGGSGMVTKQKSPGRKLALGMLEIAVVLVVLATWYVLGGSAWLRGLVPGAAPTQAAEANNPIIEERTATPLPGAGTGGNTASDVVTPTPTAASMTYTVHDGDTCEGIAGFYGVTVAALMEANGIADCTTIIPDRVLVIPSVSIIQATPVGTATPLPTRPIVPLLGQKIVVINLRTSERMGQYDSLAELRAGEPDWQAEGRVLLYTLSEGEDTFELAKALDLQGTSLAWSNSQFSTTSGENGMWHPQAGHQIMIPPVDGVVYRVQAGDFLSGIADYFQVSVTTIVGYAPNGLNADLLSINVAQLLVIPGGRPRTAGFGLPTITRDSASTATGDPGACLGPFSGPVGQAAFVWPTDNHYLSLSGVDFIPDQHPGLDLAAAEGAPVYVVDAGVVVFAGWNDSGYGNLIIVDHGNGWQSAYAHLSAVQVACGQAVEAGSPIGAAGSTGNIVGPALHFELVEAGQGPVNPWLYLP